MIKRVTKITLFLELNFKIIETMIKQKPSTIIKIIVKLA